MEEDEASPEVTSSLTTEITEIIIFHFNNYRKYLTLLLYDLHGANAISWLPCSSFKKKNLIGWLKVDEGTDDS